MFEIMRVPIRHQALSSRCCKIPTCFTDITRITACTREFIDNAWTELGEDSILTPKHTTQFERRERQPDIQISTILFNIRFYPILGNTGKRVYVVQLEILGLSTRRCTPFGILRTDSFTNVLPGASLNNLKGQKVLT